MLTTIHTKNKPSAVATLRKESVDKPSAFGYLIMETQEEIWKDVVGWEGLYQVSSLGRIKSLSRKTKMFSTRWNCWYYQKTKDRILKQHISHRGYNRVELFIKSSETHGYYVHVLVAKAFIDNPNSKQTVNHINEIKTDNRVENLEWATHYEQMQHYRNNGVKKYSGQFHYRAKITEEQAIEIIRSNEPNSNICRKYNLSKSAVWSIRNGVSWRLLHNKLKNDK